MAWCACNDEMENPGYSEIPHITLESIEVFDGEFLDSIKISIGYQDGDADLGLNGNEQDYPYQYFEFPTKESGDYIHYSEDWNDTLPEYNCSQWQYFVNINRDTIKDTIFVKRNKYFNNFHVDWLVKKGKEFAPFELFNELCILDIDGRFPRIASNNKVIDPEGPFRIEQKSKWEGIITFTPYSNSFYKEFPYDTVKFRIHIIDRALNESNVVETDEIVLP